MRLLKGMELITMTLLNILSLLLFMSFLICYMTKLVIMNKKAGIKALVLAKGKKGESIDSSEKLVQITTFLWGVVWLFESIFSYWIANFLPSLFSNNFINYFGLLIILIGLVFFVSSMITMKNSWRVGIDKNTKTELITNGLYRYSRNPAFVGFNLMFMGLFITFPNMLSLLICIMNILSIHNLILQEEKHLESMLKDEYLIYRNTTPRYLFF